MNAEQGLCHLLFHFSKQDGKFDEAEIDLIAAKIITLGIGSGIDFKKEVGEYIQSRKEWSDQEAYLEYIVSIIKPVNILALFSWCVEICLADELISIEEEQLLNQLASVLAIDNNHRDIIRDVMVERKVVDLNKII